MKKNIPQRLIIQTKDVENITGKSPQYAQRRLRCIRARLGKEEDEFITITEFSAMMNIPENQCAPTSSTDLNIMKADIVKFVTLTLCPTPFREYSDT